MIDVAGCELRAEDLWVSYRRIGRRDTILRGVEMTALPGRVTAIIGRNGVGKTTLFRTLLGFQPSDRGRITVQGLSPREYRVHHGIGYTPEAVTFPVAWTVRDVLARGVDLASAGGDRSDTLAIAIRRSGLDSATLGKEANRCSTGVRRRLQLAFALIGEPRVVLLDEPFSGLDPVSRKHLRAEIRIMRDSGITLVLASHDLAEVARLADSVLLMEDGRLRPGPSSNSDEPLSEGDLENAFSEDGS
jgi:ABC-type multidrug transport system ATPase subunit